MIMNAYQLLSEHWGVELMVMLVFIAYWIWIQSMDGPLDIGPNGGVRNTPLEPWVRYSSAIAIVFAIIIYVWLVILGLSRLAIWLYGWMMIHV